VRFAPRRLRSITQAEVAEWKEALSSRIGPRTVRAAFQTVLAPKTDRSHRFVPLAPAILQKLWEHPRRASGGLVFLSPEGKPMNASNFHRRIWHPLLRRAGMEPPMPEYFVGTRSDPDLEGEQESAR
jgi:hypothetical protein